MFDRSKDHDETRAFYQPAVALEHMSWKVYLGTVAVSLAISAAAVAIAALVFRTFNL